MGSCSASGRLLLLNRQWIELPTSAIDYVIAHELCHLRVAEHGARFDRLLARLMPDWRDGQEKLGRAMWGDSLRRRVHEVGMPNSDMPTRDVAGGRVA